MYKATVVVASSVGLHARPAGLVAQLAAQQSAPVLISKIGGEPVDAASVLSLMTLGAGHGEEVELTSASEEAVRAVADLIGQDLDGPM
ncbi:HPr family phosphocarrier protein [Lentzea tibetensis]|uniref:HPr family phosphocarrier protein n=1 Tax=Lentzea tibetensis TaxID=2591470 RepID=A0A563EJF5_9PSEU|nr:HPr family phosphocarrier protein [Lentzea tibetensis]TWP46783.1 HPr family phosphocarrier protein [Lentzea tibetensis]